MKTFKEIKETVDKIKSGDEQAFWDKHVVAKHKHPVAPESQFTSDKKKAKRKADYDEEEDKAVYENIQNIHTKRADKQAVIVRTRDKDGKAKVYVKNAPTGEIKIAEESELAESDNRDYMKNVLSRHLNHNKVQHKVTSAVGYDRFHVGPKTYISHDGQGLSVHHDGKEAHYFGSPKMDYKKAVAAAQKLTEAKMDQVGREDGDINNDGKKDKTDSYLHARRRAIKKSMSEDALNISHKNHEAYKKASKKVVVKEDTLDEATYKLDKTNLVHHDSSSEKFAKEYAAAHKGDYTQGGPSERHEKTKEKFYSKYSKKNHRSGFAGSGDDVYTHYDTGEKYQVSKSPNGKTFYGMDHHVKKLHEEVEQIDEISQAKKDAYVRRASSDEQMANSAARQAKDSDKPYFAKMRDKRRRGLNLALKSEESEQIDEVSKKTLVNYMDKSKKETGTLQKKYNAGKLNDDDEKRFDRRLSGQNTAMNKFHGRAKVPASGVDKAYDMAQKALRKESVEQIDELSKKTLGSYVRQASADQYFNGQKAQYHDQKAKDFSGSDFFGKTSKEKHYGLASKANAKASNRDTGIERAVKRLAKEDLDEAFKVGSMKLGDGSTVQVTKESADTLNGLFDQLTSANKSKMEEHLMSGTKGFSEILAFAKEAI